MTSFLTEQGDKFTFTSSGMAGLQMENKSHSTVISIQKINSLLSLSLSLLRCLSASYRKVLAALTNLARIAPHPPYLRAVQCPNTEQVASVCIPPGKVHERDGKEFVSYHSLSVMLLSTGLFVSVSHTVQKQSQFLTKSNSKRQIEHLFFFFVSLTFFEFK
jgi:hypothetical protein